MLNKRQIKKKTENTHTKYNTKHSKKTNLV